jgi:3-oxoacyl-(acyl-carrier-protein) synthase/acyl carrier protein
MAVKEIEVQATANDMNTKVIELETIVYHDDPMVSDHVVHGTRVLPGVFLLDLVLRMTDNVIDLRVEKSLEHVVFFQPVVTTEEYNRHVRVSFTPMGQNWSVRITSRRLGKAGVLVGGEELHAECLYPVGPVAPCAPIDIRRKQLEAYCVRDIDEVYAIARACDIQHFEFMKTLGKVFVGEDYLVAELGLSEAARSQASSFSVHPVILDAATGVPIYFKKHEFYEERKPFIPFFLERFTRRSPTADGRCYVLATSNLSETNNDLLSYSVVIYNQNGQLHAQLEGLKLKKIRSSDLITLLAVSSASEETQKCDSERSQTAGENEQRKATSGNRISVEAYLRDQVGAVASIDPSEIDIHKGFYELGLDSADLLRLVRNIEKTVGLELFPTLLFEHSSIAQLALYLKNGHGILDIAVVATESGGGRVSMANDGARPETRLLDVHRERRARSLRRAPLPANTIIFDSNDCLAGEIEKNVRGVTVVLGRWGNTFDFESQRRYIIRSGHKSDYEDLLKKLNAQSGVPACAVVNLTGRRDEAATGSIFKDVFCLTQALLEQKGAETIVMVLVIDETCPEQTALKAFAKSAVKENSALAIRVMTCPLGVRANVLGAEIVALLIPDQAGAAYEEWETGSEIVTAFSEIGPKAAGGVEIRQGGTYLITGGLKGVGYVFARHLAETHRARLALTGRAAIDETLAPRLAELRRGGADISYYVADACDPSAMAAVVDDIRARHGGLNGVIHNAGMKRDGFLISKNPESVQEVLNAKIGGLVLLDELTKTFDLDFVVLNSSLSAVFGNPGQSDYAYANAYLDAYAVERNRRVANGERSGLTRSIDWPLWESGGMQLDVQERAYLRDKFGLEPIDDRAAMAALEESLRANASQVIVFNGNYARFREEMGGLIASPPPEAPNAMSPVPTVRRAEEDAIAIVGLTGTYAKSNTLDEFWENLRSGADLVTEVPAARWKVDRYFNSDRTAPGATYCKWGSFIEDVDKFDPLFFNISPAEAELMDPHERKFLQTAWAVLEDAGYRQTEMPRDVGVFVGAMWNDYQLYGTSRPASETFIPTSSYLSTIANRVSYCLNLTGPSLTVDTLCSSSLVAIHLACESIRRGECSMAIAGGVNFTVHPIKYLRLSHMQMLSPTGRCRSFGAGADGYVPGEGVGAILIKPLAAAQRDGDQVYGVIRGSAVRHGGRTGGYTVPSPAAQSALIEEVFRKYAIDPETLGYVEAHGTGTSLGDPIEVEGLTKAYSRFTDKSCYCAMGSVKSNIGHLEAAAGIAGVTKVLLQMKHKTLVPTLHAEATNPKIRLDNTPFYLQTAARRWETSIGLRASVSSFGASGVNCCMVIDGPTEKDPLSRSAPGGAIDPQLIVISAKTESALRQAAANLYEYITKHESDPEVTVSNVALTLQLGRVEMERRYATVASDLDDLKKALQRFGEIGGGRESPDVARVKERRQLTAEEEALLLRSPCDRDDIERMRQIWLSGGIIDWALLRRREDCRRISLPTYPFAKERYWVEPFETARPITSDAAAGQGAERAQCEPLRTRETAVDESEGAKLRDKLQSFLVARISCELKMDPQKLNVDEPLTDYGIDSVKILKLNRELESLVGTLPVMMFFEHNTVSALATFLSENRRDELSRHFTRADSEDGAELKTIGRQTVNEPADQTTAG